MEEFDKIIGSATPTLVDFFAEWCGPCKMQAPILQEVKKAVGDKANIIKIDIDKNKEIAARYRVMSIPTLVIFKNGQPQWRVSGLHQAADLIAKLKEVMDNQ